MKKQLNKQLLSLLLVVCLCFSLAAPAAAAPQDELTFTQVDNSAVSGSLLTKVSDDLHGMSDYLPTDMVRVSIFLEDEATLMAGYSIDNIAGNAQAMAYRADLKANQAKVTAAIEKALGEKLDVAWNLTLAANLISANVQFGQIEAIEQVSGVSQVLVETCYAPDVVAGEEAADPNMATSSAQIGSPAAWAAGYTGAGSRIAVIDTGVDTDHQSMNPDAFQYSLANAAGKAGMDVQEYLAEIDLLDAAEIDAVAEQLNAPVTGAEAYINSKLPFGYNYVDGDLDVTHDNDAQGGHGSHVSGIATANSWLYLGEDNFVSAMDSAMVQGVAPDAQLITMKVFGKSGGAYDSDYMAAIEDAIVLGCDSANLSLGSSNPGTSKNATAEYQAILDSLEECGMVVAMSAGNSGYWAENAYNAGYLYNTDVSMDTAGSPGSFTNSLAVASVDNDGSTGYFVEVNGMMVVYNETTGYSNQPFTTIAGEQEYVFIDAIGTAEDWAKAGDALAGKIALCWRGETSFYEKAQLAVEAGAIATFICNNQSGIINMDLTDYPYDAPCASITQADGLAILAASEPVADADGNVLYYTGKMTVGNSLAAGQFNSSYYTMSSFSSWGVPGSLELKPEITAPGGSIYSLNGEAAETDQYTVMSGTSMASPQVAGMAAVVAQYIRENDLEALTGLSARQLAQSLLMSTAVPMLDASGSYYSVMQQGAGLANVGAVTSADSYITMADGSNAGAADGKVKVEWGDDPAKNGSYTATFDIHNMSQADETFDLSADFFIQAPTMDNVGNLYMYTSTALIGADVTWTVDGEPIANSYGLNGMDFNGDGDIDSDDGQALLDYATGVSESLENLDKADVDGDGDVDSHDAYEFLSVLTTGTVPVAAGDSITVTVNVQLSDDWKETIDYYYPNGTYIQGYLYAQGYTDDEGNVGTGHSIPVLGFFGNWTDASMFDVGTYQTFDTGDETRTPYLGDTTGNTWAVTYANEPNAMYYLGGNPMVPDETYLPERNAINSNDVISGLSFILIRNAAASQFYATNLTTGELLGSNELGAVSSAYYYTNGGYWNNTGYSLNTALPAVGGTEGDQIYAALTLAPEYYVDAEGNVDWDALGAGATFDITMTVDNTAPILEDVSMSLTGKTMTVTASDNEYVSAVALYNKAGTKVLAYTGAKQDIDKGETAKFTFDISEVNGKQFLLQVTDYAMNTTTYLIEMQIGEELPLPEMMAFDLFEGFWITFDQTTDYSSLAEYASAPANFYAATIVDHYVLAVTGEGDLYVMPETDLTDLTYVANVGTMLTDMAYNKADGNVYAVDENGDLVTVDKLTGEVAVVGTIGVTTNTLACDAEGTFYCNASGTGEVYSFTLDTMDAPVLLTTVLNGEGEAFVSQYEQTMEINPNTGMLCWNSFYTELLLGIFEIGYSYYYEIDPATGEATMYEDLWDEMTCLIIPEKTTGGGWTTPTDKVSGLTLSAEELNMLKGGNATLSATVTPWTASDRTVTWATDNAEVATVNENGVVTAINEGTAIITATSNLDASFTASCTVTVETLKVTIEGTLQDADGNSLFYTWNMETDETWTAGNEIDTSMTSATYSTREDMYYIVDSASDAWAMHKVGKDGVTAELAGNGAGVPLWDMAYSEYFSGVRENEMVNSIYYYYFLSPKDPMNLDTRAFDLSSYVNYLTAVASMGYEEYWDEEDEVMLDAEHVVMLDDMGTVWNFWIYDTEDGMSAWFNSCSSNLPCTFPGDSDMENMYTSMVAGDDGALYVSSFNGDTNELYRLTYNENTETYDAALIGDVGQDVWPATITKVTTNAPAEESNPAAMPKATEKMTAVTVSVEDLANVQVGHTRGSGFTMNADAKAAKAELLAEQAAPAAQTKIVSVQLNASDLTTNGVASVTWDASELAFEAVLVNGDYIAKKVADDSLTFGYVSLDGIEAGQPIATLTFKALTNEDATVTVEYKQFNNAAGTTEIIPVACAHANTEVKDAVAATCTTAGYTGDTYCTDCGALVIKGEIIPATGHTFGEWVVVTEATCTTDGLKTHTCTVCDYTETEVIAATGIHVNTEVKGAVAATCTTDGYTGDTYCTDCGALVTKSEVIPATGHTFGEWTVITEATCTTDGLQSHTCTACDYTETEVIAATGVHANTEVKGAVAATCTTAGYTGDTYCTDCGALVTEGEVIPATGHTFGEWVVVTEASCTDGLKTHTCTVCGETESEVIPGDCASENFTDVPVDTWFHDAVDFVVEKGLMNGMSETTFGPSATMNRGMMVTVLYRLAGEPAVTEAAPFTDVPEGKFFSEAVAWAYTTGIAQGVSATAFDPTSDITREQMVTFLYRYAKYAGMDVTVKGDLSAYTDADTVSSWAVEAMTWAVGQKLVKGMPNATLEPTQISNRAQIATILMRFCA